MGIYLKKKTLQIRGFIELKEWNPDWKIGRQRVRLCASVSDIRYFTWIIMLHFRVQLQASFFSVHLEVLRVAGQAEARLKPLQIPSRLIHRGEVRRYTQVLHPASQSGTFPRRKFPPRVELRCGARAQLDGNLRPSIAPTNHPSSQLWNPPQCRTNRPERSN